MSGIFMEYQYSSGTQWNMSGICFEYQWNMSGALMEYEWNIHGISMEH